MNSLPHHGKYMEEDLKDIRSDLIFKAALSHLYHDNTSVLKPLLKEGGIPAVENHLLDLYQQAVKFWDRELKAQNLSQQQADELTMNQVIAPPSDLSKEQPELTPDEMEIMENYINLIEAVGD